MTNIEVKLPFISFFLCLITSYVQLSNESNHIFHQTNKKLLEVIDDVFVSFRINKNFNGSKNIADYLSMKNFIQGAGEKTDQVYEHARHISKTKETNRSVNSNINKVIDEIIGEQKAEVTQDLSNNSNYITKSDDRVLKDFVNLANRFDLKINTLLSDDLWGKEIQIQNLTRRIFDGNETTVRKYPFIASIHVRGRFSCAGSLIREDLVITAASCLIQLVYQKFDPTAVVVRVGSDFANKAGKLIPTASLYFHPRFNPSNLNHNLVIIRLRTRLKLEKTKVISIKFDREANDIPGDVKEVIILGWGEKKSSENRGDSIAEEDRRLSQAPLDMYNLKKCKDTYSRFYVNSLNFCAGFVYKGSGACKNDVGGPAIAHSKLMGVVSFGSPHCGRPNAPTVFTKIGAYTTWIDSVFKKVPLCKPPECKLRQFSNENSAADISDETIHKSKLEPKNREHVIVRQKTDVRNPDENYEIYGAVEAADTFTKTPTQDVFTHPLISKSIFLDPELVDLPKFSEEKTEDDTPPIMVTTAQPLAADKAKENLDWDYFKHIVDQILELPTTAQEITSKYIEVNTEKATTTHMTIFTNAEMENAYGEFTFKIDDKPFGAFTRMGDSIDESDTNISNEDSANIKYERDHKMLNTENDPGIPDQKSELEDILLNANKGFAIKNLDNEHEDIKSNTESDPENKDLENNQAEIIIIDSGTTLRYMLDKRNPIAVDEIDRLKENFADSVI